MNARRRNKYNLQQAGFILLPIVMAMTLISIIAFMMNRSSSIDLEREAAAAEALKALYVAKAGAAYARYQLSLNCNQRGTIIDTFGAHSFVVTITDNPGITVHIESIGTLDTGVSQKVTADPECVTI